MLDRLDVEERDERSVRTSSSLSVAESRRVCEPAVAKCFEAFHFDFSDSRERLLSWYKQLSMSSHYGHCGKGLWHTSLCGSVKLIAAFGFGSRSVGSRVMLQVAHLQYWRVAVARHQALSRALHGDLGDKNRMQDLLR
jgi:hypothetical protein